MSENKKSRAIEDQKKESSEASEKKVVSVTRLASDTLLTDTNPTNNRYDALDVLKSLPFFLPTPYRKTKESPSRLKSGIAWKQQGISAHTSLETIQSSAGTVVILCSQTDTSRLAQIDSSRLTPRCTLLLYDSREPDNLLYYCTKKVTPYCR